VTLAQTATLAQQQAASNFARNLEALAQTQRALGRWLNEQLLELEWVFAKDRALSAQEPSGQWIGGCSLPRRVAQALLARQEVRGSTACFLAPPHAAALRVALDKLAAQQAIVAIVPDMRDLAIMLHCEDFADDIRASRLWCAAGPAWDVSLRSIFDDQEGLATPAQFIRTPDADPELIQSLISTAQAVFSQVHADRAARMQALVQSPAQRRRSPGTSFRLCVVAPMRFRLWNDIGHAMMQATQQIGGVETVVFDADSPTNSSPLALLKVASSCDAILTANTARTDLPAVLPESLPWITWITQPRIPSAALAATNDHLIVTDPALRDAAVRAGWPATRVCVGNWPEVQSAAPTARPAGAGCLAIITDTFPLDTPPDLMDYSSHGLLWEYIREELRHNPLALSHDIDGYLAARMAKINIAQANFPRARFIEKLIVPAYQQGLARTLLCAGLRVRLFGAGWEALDEFRPHAAGAVSQRQQLQDIAAASAALIHVWPFKISHPIDALGVPVLTAHRCRRAQDFVRSAQAALQGRPPAPAASSPQRLTGSLIASIVRNIAAA